MSNHLVHIFTSDFYTLPPLLQEEIYYDFYHLVYGVAFYFLKDHAASEDVVQESFLRALRKSSQLEDIEKLEGWLKTLTRNVALNYLKKFKKTRDELVFDAVVMYETASTSSFSDPVDQTAEVNMMRKSLIHYLDQLNPRYRKIVILRWIYGLSYREIGKAIGLPEKDIRQKLYRAREMLRKRMQQDWGIDE